MARLYTMTERFLDWVRAEHPVLMNGMKERSPELELKELARRVSWTPTARWQSIDYTIESLNEEGIKALRSWIEIKGWEKKAPPHASTASASKTIPSVIPDEDLMKDLDDGMGGPPDTATAIAKKPKSKRREPEPAKLYDDWGSW